MDLSINHILIIFSKYVAIDAILILNAPITSPQDVITSWRPANDRQEIDGKSSDAFVHNASYSGAVTPL